MSKEEVNDLVLLDGEREEIDLLQGLDLAVLHQAAELGHRDPFLLLLAPATSPAAVSTAPAPIATAPASPASISESSTESPTITGWSCVRCLPCLYLRILHGTPHDHRLELRPPYLLRSVIK